MINGKNNTALCTVVYGCLVSFTVQHCIGNCKGLGLIPIQGAEFLVFIFIFYKYFILNIFKLI